MTDGNNDEDQFMLTYQTRRMLRIGLGPCLVLALMFVATESRAQEPPPPIVPTSNNQNVSGEQTTTQTSSPSAQVVVQSISGGGSNYRMTPNAPGMPSFAGGPCIAASAAASAAVPGVSIGGGVSKEDEACQRRNWVQTLVGASQQMSPEDALFLKRLAYEVMRDDEYLSPAFARLGVAPPTNSVRKNIFGRPQTVTAPIPAAALPAAEPAVGAPDRSTQSAAASRAAPVARASKDCVVVVAQSVPAQMKSLLSGRGCQVLVR